MIKRINFQTIQDNGKACLNGRWIWDLASGHGQLFPTCKACSDGRWWVPGREGWSGSKEGSTHSGGKDPDHGHQSHRNLVMISIAVILTCTRGQEGSWTWSSRFAARAPLRNVGPRLIVMLANLIKKDDQCNVSNLNKVIKVIKLIKVSMVSKMTKMIKMCLINDYRIGWSIRPEMV